MLKFKLCRICMKQKKANTAFVKIYESKEMGDLVANIIIDFANVSVHESDGLPHIICTNCFENLIKCREFQKLVVQNDTTLASLAEKSPDEIERMIAEPLIRIEKVKKSEESTIVQLDTNEDVAPVSPLNDPLPSEISSSEDEDDFPIENEVPEMPVVAAQLRLMCCCCPLQFDEEYEIIQHMKDTHTAIRNKLNIAPVDKDPREVKQCELCLKYVVGLGKLLEHQAQYKNCKQCVECGGFFQKKGKLFCQCKKPEEPKLIPSKMNQCIKKVRCEICSSYVKDIKAHNYSMHGKLLKCQQCDFTTEQKIRMVRHATSHLEKKFPCPYPGCGKMFVSSNCAALKTHLPRHTGDRKFVCKFCGKSFGDNSDCRRHEWQHTGVSPYMCSKCNKMFLRKNHLLTHEDKCTG